MEDMNTNQEGRVRRSSTDKANQAVDQEILENISQYGYASLEALEDRIEELNKEWDIERVLEVNASTLALTGVLLGFAKDKRWFIVPGIVTTFLLQHGLQGWCPPLPVLRKLGFRTRKEIDEERYALKILRGDFEQPSGKTAPETLLKIVRK
ncbi:hypothetical protein [Adhaeribacter terreus]|uniref:DUF2892 domain-containing protein n=1 Tax=Adhaeribacter terreus TaxID=529703 RepID=A0ABW0E539_9BACT